MSIRTRLILAFVGIVLLTSLLALSLSYTTARRYFIEQTRQELMHLASTIASAQEAEALRGLTIERQADAQYQAVKDRFRRFRTAIPEARIAYFYKATEKPGVLELVVDTLEPNEPLAITPAPEQRYYDAGKIGAPRMIEGLDHPTADDEPIVDDTGTWLSGYAPVRAKDRSLVGAIGIDLAANQIAERQHKLLDLLIFSSLGALGVALLGAVVLGRAISRPIQELAQATRVLAGGDLAARVQIVRSDELGQLGRDFNQMGSNLQAMAEALKSYTSEAIETHEEKMALQLQKLLLPPGYLGAAGATVVAALRPIPWGGGDTYQYFLFGQGAYLFLAYGHVHASGLVACSLMTLLHSRQNQLVSELVLRPAEQLKQLSDTVSASASGLAAVDWFCAVYDLGARALAYSGAGQLGAFLVRPEPFALQLLESGAATLGEATEFTDVDLEIQPGDRVLICSVQALEKLGAGPFEGLVRQHVSLEPSRMRDALLADLEKANGEQEPSDDLTVLVAQLGAKEVQP